MWLRAASLRQANGSLVPAWFDESGSGRSVTQTSPALQPLFIVDAFGAGSAGLRFDGAATYLVNETIASLPEAAQTHFAVFRDSGSTGGDPGYVCCSGVTFIGGGSGAGLSTVPPSGGAATDDDGNGNAGSPVVPCWIFEEALLLAAW